MPRLSRPDLSPGVSIDHLIQEYRDGDTAAAEILLQRFQPYLTKWRRLLIYNRWDSRDQEVRHFLYLLGGATIETTLQVMDIRLQAYEKEDLQQECAITLLDSARRYGNIIRYYRYLLKERVKDLISDPLVASYPYNLPIEGSLVESTVPDIDSLWVSGITCSLPFESLRERDREVLREVKWYGYTIAQTAERIGTSQSTVNRSLRRSRDTLKERDE